MLGTLIAELVGFVVIVFVLYRYVWPTAARMLRERQDAVQKQVEESEEASRRLKQAEERFEAAVSAARREAATIRDDARADAQRIREELQHQAEAEVTRIRQRGEEQLVAQREQMVRRLRAEIGGLTTALAEQIIVESLSDDDRRRTSVDRFLDGLDEMAGRTAGDATDNRDPAPAGGGMS